jgi:glycerophosphoryl diester phosphodiesterase
MNRRRIIVNITICLLATSLSVTVQDLLSASENTADRVEQIIAHRGASAERPECTLSAFARAIEVGATAVEMDVRTTHDGKLYLLHDATLNRTTNGEGPASDKTLAQLKQLDAGSWFDKEYQGERIPELREALNQCKTKIDVLLDLKEQGTAYAQQVAAEVIKHGAPKRTIVGVRSVEQALLFRKLLPEARQLGLIPNPQSIAAFVDAKVETIRLWPAWLKDNSLVPQIKQLGAQLHLNGSTGLPNEVLPLIAHQPFSLSADDPATLIKTLKSLQHHHTKLCEIRQQFSPHENPPIKLGLSRSGARTFLNRDYEMMALPQPLVNAPRIIFNGGAGDQIKWKFTTPTVIFAAFQYNDSGAWSFRDGHQPGDFGWQRLAPNAYQGSSNAELGGKSQQADIYYCEFTSDQTLQNLPSWWVCLGVLGLHDAQQIKGFKLGKSSPIYIKTISDFSYEQWSSQRRPLAVPTFKSFDQWAAWQEQLRKSFRQDLVFPYSKKLSITPRGPAEQFDKYSQQEFTVSQGDQRLFRFFQLQPNDQPTASIKRKPTIVCFMGHGKVAQILNELNSYQHACARQFVEQGYQVFALENVGMEPPSDRHHELDRLLRLDGYSWYSLLFAHQQILLDYVFEQPRTDVKRVGVTGVSTGGLLALSAAAMDTRIAATSVQGIFGSMRVSFIQDRQRHCGCGAIPNLLPAYDLPELALLVTPRALHVSNAKNDGFSPDEAQRCLKIITPLYRQAGGEQPQFSVPAGSHEFAFSAALQFFQDTIGNP